MPAPLSAWKSVDGRSSRFSTKSILAQGLSHARRREMPDDELIERHPPALIGGGDVDPIVDAEVIEPGADCTDTSPTSKAERSSSVGRRSYTIRDFDTSEAGPCRDAPSSPTGGYRYTGEEAPGRAGSL